MTMYMHRWAAAADPYGTAPQKPRRKRWFDVRFIDLVRPDGYWPQPYTLEQAFEIFRWMVAKGKGYSTQERWGSRSVVDLLSATSGIGYSSVIPVSSLDDLRGRFHYAVLGMAQCEAQARWRSDFDIGPSGKARLAVPVYRPFAGARHLGFPSERAIHDAFESLTTGHRGRAMAVPFNYIHLGSRYLHGVSVGVYPGCFRFSLTFGEDPVERCASRWDETIAVTRPGETFLDTFARARDVFNIMALGAEGSCDAAGLLESCQYHPAWHRDHIAAFARGDRPELPATKGGLLLPQEANAVAAHG